MSIYKRRSGRWAVLIDLEATTAGLRRRKSIGTYRTRKEAEAAERKALEARDRGIDLSPQTVTVKELLERYIERCRAKALATKTLERYHELAKCHLLSVIGGVILSKLKPTHVLSVYIKATQKGLSPKTVRHVHGLLHAALDWAIEQNLCFRNVADASKRDLPNAQRSPAKALTEAEARRLLDAATGTPWHAFFTLAFCTGARRAELAALRWSNVDLERGIITISESVVRTKSGLEFKGTKTGCIRVVPLNALAVAALRFHRAVQNTKRLRKGHKYQVRDLVFADPFGRPWNPSSISNAFVRLARETKLPTQRLHDVRHSAATWLLQSGIDVRTVAAVLGHSTPVTTLNTYAHVMPGAEAKAVEAIAERLGRAKPEAS
ncbi:MAG TPA: site-specific integrase [Candidatus Cybelea sp.]